MLPLLGFFTIKILYYTNRKKFHAPESLPQDAFILGCWHHDLLMLQYLYFQYKKPHVKAMISNHFDGELIAKTLSYYGIGSIAGSTTRNAARVLIQAIKTIKGGMDLAMTPDGPRGPRHEVADGIVVIAQKTGAKIILVSVKPTKYWQLNSWDKFIIPKPFGTIHFYAQEIDVSGMEIEEAKELIRKGLLEHEE